jgi:hypothetical protein
MSAKGTLEVTRLTPEREAMVLGRIAAALGERFDRVEMGRHSIAASASDFRSVVRRGPAFHPLRGFERIDLRVEGRAESAGLRYELGLLWQLGMGLFAWAAWAAIFRAIPGLPLRLALIAGFVVAAAMFLVRFGVKVWRAQKWLVSQWPSRGGRF